MDGWCDRHRQRVVTCLDGQVWIRRLARQASAWGCIVRGCNSRSEWLARKADMIRAGWRVAEETKDQDVRVCVVKFARSPGSLDPRLLPLV